MTWILSRFRVGALVEVRSREEILATLDQYGCLDGMPFMPEMLQYCGRRFRVNAVAHKTCETAHKTFRARRLDTTVHLTGLRCDGSAHGGCEAECNLFWKDVWLKSVTADCLKARSENDTPGRYSGGCTADKLFGSTRLILNAEKEEPRYSCQATKLYEATKPLAWWNPRQYVRDVITGNHSVRHVLRVVSLACLHQLHRSVPRGYRMTKALYEWIHLLLTGREAPDFQGEISRNRPTPTGRLDLEAGQHVRIKSKQEIAKTLHQNGENRGLYFDVEMSRYCGSTATVRRSVTKIVDELTGKMRHMKQPCVVLEGVVCNSEYSSHRLMCPRAFLSYWREIWLEKREEK